jgi:hypothetical protein
VRFWAMHVRDHVRRPMLLGLTRKGCRQITRPLWGRAESCRSAILEYSRAARFRTSWCMKIT